MDGLINDAVFKCLGSCEETFRAYTESGETNFCPVCGTRNIEAIDEEDDE